MRILGPEIRRAQRSPAPQISHRPPQAPEIALYFGTMSFHGAPPILSSRQESIHESNRRVFGRGKARRRRKSRGRHATRRSVASAVESDYRLECPGPSARSLAYATTQ